MHRIDQPRASALHQPARHALSTKEPTVLYHHYALARIVHAERLARGIAEREGDRQARRSARRPLRRVIGRSIERFGARVAAEPNRRPARSR
ncbi:MAG: hypothetical protein ACRDGQ_10290 [Candidatus Limnocylindrales bacterium]